MSSRYVVRENLTVPPPRWAVCLTSKTGMGTDLAWFWSLKDAQDYEAWMNGKKKLKKSVDRIRRR